MRRHFDETQIIGFLREVDGARTLRELCRRHGFSEASHVLLQRICGGLRASRASHLRRLQLENRRLKALLQVQLLERDRIRRALSEQF